MAIRVRLSEVSGLFFAVEVLDQIPERDLEASKLKQETWLGKVIIGHSVLGTANAPWPTSGE